MSIPHGATGIYEQQLYRGDEIDIAGLEPFRPLGVSWEMEPIQAKRLVDRMPDQEREAVYACLDKRSDSDGTEDGFNDLVIEIPVDDHDLENPDDSWKF